MKKNIKCNYCNEDFIIEIRDILTSNNYDVKKIINGDVFLYECPHCHKNIKINHPLSYIDNTSKNVLIYNSIPALYYIKEMTKNDLFGFKIKAANSEYDFRTKLTALINNLNIKALKINEVFLSEYAKDKNVAKLYLGYDENNSLAYHFYDSMDNYLFTIPFTKDAYDKILIDYKDYLDYIDDYLLDDPKKFVLAVKNNYNFNKRPKNYAIIDINKHLYLGRLMCSKKKIGESREAKVKINNEFVNGNIYAILSIKDINLPNIEILKVYPKE